MSRRSRFGFRRQVRGPVTVHIDATSLTGVRSQVIG